MHGVSLWHHIETRPVTVQSDRSLCGASVSGTRSATIPQSPWTDGLKLEMMLRHGTSLLLLPFNELQDNLARQYGWEAANDPNVTASLDMDDSMMMTEPMNYQELAEWEAEQIEKVLPGLSAGC